MILVVFSHLYIPNHSLLNELFINFRMPLFFFLSGFISFRHEQQWSGEELWRRVVTKMRMLLLPTLVFGVLFTLVVDRWSIAEFIMGGGKKGYWFTFVLFNMLVLYYVVRYVVACRGRGLKGAVWGMLLVGCVALFLNEESWLECGFARLMSLQRMFSYMVYFALGIIAGYYRDTFIRMVANLRVWTLATMLFLLSSVLKIEYGVVGDVERVVELMLGVMGIVMVFGVFERVGERFERVAVGRWLQYVGRHTLEVYVIHYLLLINFLPSLRCVVAEEGALLIPFVVGLPLAVAVTTVAVAVGYVVVRIPVVGYYVMGGRDRVKCNKK